MSSAESVAARLKHQAKIQEQRFDRILLLYFQERFLARLAKSDYKQILILKGGLYLYSVYGMATRPTRDMDFLNVDQASEELEGIFQDIASIQLDDQVEFDLKSLSSKTIQSGINLTLTAYLGRAKNVLKFDVGFNDLVTPEPQLINYPTLLAEEAITIYSYTDETVIAEKLAAMTELYLSNSRLKDFYDLYQFAQRKSVDRTILQKAIKTTFKQRTLEIDSYLILFEPEFLTDSTMIVKWEAFWKKQHKEPMPDFPDIMMAIKTLVVN